MFRGIDLYSDTVTRPTPAMRKAMLDAEVGDEQKGEDPTTLRLETMVAERLGKSAALFLPSSTMANQIAVQLHVARGEELIADENCHLFVAEGGAVAIHAGAQAKPLATRNGIFTGDQVRAAYRTAKSPNYPVSRLVSVENTTNMGGGVAWSQAQLDSVLEAAKSLSLNTHLDGARLFNAVVASGLSAKAIASRFDSVTVCLSKGLGCPVGAVLAFDQSHFETVRRLKQRMGGSLRQSGMLAAAGIHALEHHIERLADDHRNARVLAQGLAAAPFLEVETPEPSTNMVYFRWLPGAVPAEAYLARATSRGVRFSQVGPTRFRAVTHLDIASQDIDRAVQILIEVGRGF